MSNYSEDENMCRVDFFKKSGKWYTTVAIEFSEDDYNKPGIHKAFKNALMSAGEWKGGM